MFSRKLRIVAVVLVGLGATGMGLAFGQPPGVARDPAWARGRPSVPPGLSRKAQLVYRYLKLERPGEFDWERIPWLVDLREAMRQANAENRPVLLWTTDDDPLERC